MVFSDMAAMIGLGSEKGRERESKGRKKRRLANQRREGEEGEGEGEGEERRAQCNAMRWYNATVQCNLHYIYIFVSTSYSYSYSVYIMALLTLVIVTVARIGLRRRGGVSGREVIYMRPIYGNTANNDDEGTNNKQEADRVYPWVCMNKRISFSQLGPTSVVWWCMA